MTKRSIARGAWTGALIGGVLRGGVTLYHIAPVTGLFWVGIFSIPSFGFGLLAGGVGGASSTVTRGAIRGALLSALLFALFVVPVAWVFSLFGAADKVSAFTWPLFVQKAVVGALAGGIGVWVQSRVTSSALVPETI